MTLGRPTLDRVHGAWASRLDVPVTTFTSPAQVFVPRADADAVVVVALGTTTVVLGPPATLGPLRRTSRGRLVELPELLDVLAPFRPDPVGSATLAYADAIDPPSPGTVRSATEDDVRHVLAACSPDDRAESGLCDMPIRFTLQDGKGVPIALAGYTRWDGGLAHVGVATVPHARGLAAGTAVARAAVTHALGAGLVAQWRCRQGHVASARLADRLGFIPLGVQLAVDVTVA